MKVIVDTCIWSEVLRKSNIQKNNKIIQNLTELIREDQVIMLGLIRQELLSGIKNQREYLKLRDKLRAFMDYQLSTEEYELAAELFNKCRGKGVQGSNTDFLICAAAIKNNFSIFTSDKDFFHFSKYSDIRIYDMK